jgi:hypothetical protein
VQQTYDEGYIRAVKGFAAFLGCAFRGEAAGDVGTFGVGFGGAAALS